MSLMSSLQIENTAVSRPSRQSEGRGRWVLSEDCRVALKSLNNKSVSLILTDPPYFIDGMDDGWNDKKLRGRCKAGVIGGLPAGMKFTPDQGRRLQQFLHPVAQEWMRVIKPGGFVLCFSQARLVHRVAVAIEDAGFEIRDTLAWKYEGQAKAFSQDHFVRKRKDLSDGQKRALIKSLGGRKTPQLKPQMEMIVLAQAPREGTFVENWSRYRAGLIDTSDPFLDAGRFPGNIIATTKPREKHGHMTCKPVPLLRHLIRIFSDDRPGTLVLDCFAGSGSTGEAALREGRSFLGFEIDSAHAERANERIDAVANDLGSDNG
ncbi:MAG: site-specific DNA-methyltransferase [Alphaproteobacteria bacterium]|nr:site-specific DNA-methyltransferase [Alphaproteobacteria bacterium]MDA8008801.1 site-specific DNA-methyltransferase [Alphaproteobacteria bacterium]